MLLKSIKSSTIFALLILFSCKSPPPIAAKSGSTPAGFIQKHFLGISYRPVSDLKQLYNISNGNSSCGIRVISVVAGSSAYKSGISTGDIIFEYDGNKFSCADDFSKTFRSYIGDKKKVGEKVYLKLIRPATSILCNENGKESKIESLKELCFRIKERAPSKTLDFSVKDNSKILNIIVTLGPKEAISSNYNKKNSKLFPEFNHYSDKVIDYYHHFIEKYKLEPGFNDILARYNDIESWDDGFRSDIIRYIHKNPLKFQAITDITTNRLEEAANKMAVSDLITEAGCLLNENMLSQAILQELPPYPSNSEPAGIHIKFIKNIVDSALVFRNKAFNNLSMDDRVFVSKYLPILMNDFIDKEDNGDDELETQAELKLIRLLHEIDYGSLFESAEILSRICNKNWLNDFRSSLGKGFSRHPASHKGVLGTVLYYEKSTAGKIVIGGPGPNKYSGDAAIIIDMGGDDIYTGRTGSADPLHPISIAIDFSGNDQYSATDTISIGSGFMGVGILIDLEGNDHYTGIDFSQAAGLLGVGILLDAKGNDIYEGQEFNQGIGFWGIGMLLDMSGNDSYNSHLLAQGVGGPEGIGVLSDTRGNDSYYASGKFHSSYKTRGIFNGLSQGFGMGLRGIASGGIGILIDSMGQDRFIAGNFSQGGGYAFGLGILKNSGNDDDYYFGARYGQGFAAHSAEGILIDDGGNDFYSGSMGALQAAAWDLGISSLLDKSGDDVYSCPNLFFCQAASANNGLSFFTDLSGNDNYIFPKENKISGNNYHGGTSFSFFIDAGGGIDTYNSSKKLNNHISMTQRYAVMADLIGN